MVKITLEIADAEIEAALEHGARHNSYWALETGWDYPNTMLNRTKRFKGYVIDHHDFRSMPEKHTRHELDIERGLRMMYQRGPDKHSARKAKGEGLPPSWWDANQADCFVQYAAFGKRRYG
jgi:hypothetical protein